MLYANDVNLVRDAIMIIDDNRATVFCRDIPEVTFSVCLKKDGN